MNADSLFLMAEADYMESSWYADAFYGISSEIKNHGLSLTMLHPGKTGAGTVRAGDFVLVFGLSQAWTRKTIDELGRARARIILISLNTGDMPSWVSCIRIDRGKSVQELVHGCCRDGRDRMALWGIDPGSISDAERVAAFLTSAREMNLTASQSDIYLNHGSLADCWESFWCHLGQYNAVLCANDIAAIDLMGRLREAGVSVPGGMYVAGFGNTVTGRLMTPSLTSVTLDFCEAGQRAVDMALYLMKRPGVVSVIATVRCRIMLRESTGTMTIGPEIKGPAGGGEEEPIDFYADPAVDEISRLERLLAAADEIDRSILCGVLSGQTSEEISEHYFISLPSLKRRLRKMLATAEASSKADLKIKMEKYGLIDTRRFGG